MGLTAPLPATVRIDLLGPIRVHFEGRVITKFQTQKTAALLAYLAIHPGRAFPREQVAELLWPDGDPVAVRNRLNQAVSSLRRQLEPFGVDMLISDAHSIGLRNDVSMTDTEEFQELIRTATGDQFEENLRAAVALYRGDFLEGADEEWAVAQRVRHLDGYIQSLTKLMKMLVESQRFEEAIEVARQRLEVNVRDERNHRALMKLFLLAKRPDAALAQFRELVVVLDREGSSPSSKARELFETASRAGEVDGDSLFSDLAGPSYGASRVPVLPPQMNRFVGRERELARIEAIFEGGARILALVGIGGIGKSRLAIEFGWRYAAQCQNRVLRIAHSKGLDPAGLAEAMSKAYFGTPQRQIALWPKEAGDCLLIVDEADGCDLTLLNDFLARLPKLKVICCCRAGFSNPNVTCMDLGPLADGGRALYLARTASDELDADAVSLLEALNGIPLAIELAAGMVRQPTHLEPVLRTPFLRESGSTTLAEIIASSVAALPDDCKSVLDVLASWPEPMEAEAIGAAIPETDVLLALEQLESRALIHADRLQGVARFRLLPLLQAEVSSTRIALMRARIADFYEDSLARTWPLTHVVARDLASLRIAAEAFTAQGEPKRAALIAARLGFALAQLAEFSSELQVISKWLQEPAAKEDPVFWARLVAGESQFLNAPLSNSWEEREEASRVLMEAGLLSEWASLRISMAQYLTRTNQPERAKVILEEVLVAELGTHAGPFRARAFMRLGHLAVDSGDDAAGEYSYRMAASTEGTQGNSLVQAAALDSLANLANLHRKVEEARRCSEESLVVVGRLGFAARYRRVIPLMNLAEAERLAGAYERCLLILEEAAELVQEPVRQRELLQTGVQLLFDLGDLEGAAQVLGAADRIGEDHEGRQKDLFAPVLEKLAAYEVRRQEGLRQSFGDAVRWLGTRTRERLA